MDEIKILKKAFIWIVLAFSIIGAISFIINRSIKTVDTGIIRYEEFQEIHNTCTKLNLDLCNMRDLSETDKMFDQFSKAQRINTLRTQINRWTEDYNAKSKMWNHSLWKSSTLPYQLQTNQYNCY